MLIVIDQAKLNRMEKQYKDLENKWVVLPKTSRKAYMLKAEMDSIQAKIQMIQNEPRCSATNIVLHGKYSDDSFYVIDSLSPRIPGFEWLAYYGPEGLGYEMPLHLLESEIWGDEAPALIVDNTMTIVLGDMDDIWNGWEDLKEVTPARYFL